MQKRLGHSRPPPKVRLLGINDLHAPSTRETNSSLYPSRESLYSLILNLHLRDERAGRKAADDLGNDHLEEGVPELWGEDPV